MANLVNRLAFSNVYLVNIPLGDTNIGTFIIIPTRQDNIATMFHQEWMWMTVSVRLRASNMYKFQINAGEKWLESPVRRL
jgi:hypothetical protein